MVQPRGQEDLGIMYTPWDHGHKVCEQSLMVAGCMDVQTVEAVSVLAYLWLLPWCNEGHVCAVNGANNIRESHYGMEPSPYWAELVLPGGEPDVLAQLGEHGIQKRMQITTGRGLQDLQDLDHDSPSAVLTAAGPQPSIRVLWDGLANHSPRACGGFLQ